MKPILSGFLRTSLMALMFLCITQRASTGATPDPVKTPDELQSMFSQGQYKDLLPPLNKALTDKATLAKADSHYALLMLKGETMLRMKASGSAQDAFTAASLVVGADDNSIAIAKATVSLVKRSGNAKYQPKTKAEGSTSLQPAIDILSTDNRKLAFAALFTDLFEPAKPIVATAEKATTLEPIVDVTPQLSEIRCVEIAATGSDTQSKDLLQKLAAHAKDLMDAALKPFDDQLSTITKDASKKMRGSRAYAGATAARSESMTTGLSPANVDTLDSAVSTAREIAAAADKLQTAFGNAGDFKDVKAAAEKIITEANKLLAKYNKPTA